MRLPLTMQVRTARDIYYKRVGSSDNYKETLAKEVLKEVPKQMTDFFLQNGIRPNPRAFIDKRALEIK